MITEVVLFLEIVFILLIGYVGIILGYKSNKNKMGRSIVIGFVLYFIFQAITLGLIGVFGLFNPEVMNLINTTDIVNIDSIEGAYLMSGKGIWIHGKER